MTEILQYGFMQRAVLAGLIIAPVLAVISFFIVLRGLSFIGVGISHSAFAGVALGVLFGVEPSASALVFCIIVANLITATEAGGGGSSDTVIGIFFSLTMAVGMIAIGLSDNYTVDVFGYLFGSLLGISGFDLWLAAISGAMVLLIIALFFKELLFGSFDRELAISAGIPARGLEYLFNSLVAASVVISVKLVGVVLASALLIIPGAAARRLAQNWRVMLPLSVIISTLSTLTGLMLAHVLDIAPGAGITVTASLVFFLTLFKR